MGKVNILEKIKKRIVVLDGAMGSLLIEQGLPVGTPPEYWNCSNPEKVQKAHKDYFEAGSDVVLTNTFGASKLKLTAHKHGENVEEYNLRAVEIAKAICPEDCYVAGDIGPSGAFLPPVGNITIDEFRENYLEQAKILADAGVDFFFIETMVDLLEAEAAVKAVKKVSNKPIFASMTYQKTKRGYFTIMGNSVEQCADVLQKAGVDVIGANCTISSNEMIDLVSQLKIYSKVPICAKPNAGKPQFSNGKTVYPTTQNEFIQDILQMVEKQVNVVGGCCGSNPAFIKKIAHLVKR